MNSFDFCYCSLGYGALMQTMHHSIFPRTLSEKSEQNINATAILIHGPKGVGKRSLARILSHQLLTGHPWFSQSIGLGSITQKSFTSDDHMDGPLGGMDALAGGFKGLAHEMQGALHPIYQALPRHWKQSALLWEKEHMALNTHPEYRVVASNSGIDDIRKLRQQLSYTRFVDSLRVVVLPEVQSLGLSSMNALLKWIESPGPQTVFILTASGVLPETVRSRCIEYTMPALDWGDFSRVRSCVQAMQAYQDACDETELDLKNWNPMAQRYLFKVSQGALMRAHIWQDHLPWVMQTWSVLYHCATQSPVVDPEWLSMALDLGDLVWDVLYIWARDVGNLAYAQGFLHHWDYFWHDTWDLVLQHRIYHTDPSHVIQTVAARIHGFFIHYGIQPVRNPDGYDAI